MSLLVETYIFYADVYFVQNYLIKIAVLYLAIGINKQQVVRDDIKRIGRICVAGCFGTLFEIIWLLLFRSYVFLVVLIYLVEMPLTIVYISNKKKIPIVRMMFTCVFFTLLINGVLEILWNKWGQQGGYVFFLVLACIIVMIGVRIWRNEVQVQKGIYEIELMHAGKQIVTQGFYDSGNILKDPYTQKGVHIIAEEILKKIEIDVEKKVWVPYHSVGNESGLVEVYYIDRICIYGEKETIEQTKCPLGITKDNLFKDKKYKMILNEEVF